MKKVMYLFLSLVVLISLISCSKGSPVGPENPTYRGVDVIYERVYAIVQTLDQRLPEAVIPDVPGFGNIRIDAQEIVKNDKYSFSSGNRLEAGDYEIYVVHLLVQTEDRTSVGRKITINGVEMVNPVQRGDIEFIKFRIDSNGNVSEIN